MNTGELTQKIGTSDPKKRNPLEVWVLDDLQALAWVLFVFKHI